MEKTGVYECKAENADGIARKTFNVSVVEFPSIIHTIDDIIINPTEFKSELFSVSCFAVGLPNPEVYWTFNEERIHDGDVFQINLSMQPGTYKCVAENSEGKVETAFNVEILSKPELLDGFDTSQSVTSIPEGETLNLICPFKNYEDFTWKKESESHGEILEQFFNQTLKLTNVDLQNEGKYTCTAFNDVGNSSFTYTLEVLTKPTIEVLDLETNKIMFKNFHQEEYFLKLNGDFKMTCKSHGNPQPKNVFMKSSKLIREGDSLDIKNISVEDVGAYTCSAENSQGVATRSYKIDVYESPYVKSGSNDIRIVEFVGDPISLECNVDGYPKPKISWFKDE